MSDAPKAAREDEITIECPRCFTHFMTPSIYHHVYVTRKDAKRALSALLRSMADGIDEGKRPTFDEWSKALDTIYGQVKP